MAQKWKYRQAGMGKAAKKVQKDIDSLDGADSAGAFKGNETDGFSFQSQNPDLFKKSFTEALEYLREHGLAGEIDAIRDKGITIVDTTDEETISDSGHLFDHNANRIFFNTTNGLQAVKFVERVNFRGDKMIDEIPLQQFQSPALGFLNEAGHARQFIYNREKYLSDRDNEIEGWNNAEEKE